MSDPRVLRFEAQPAGMSITSISRGKLRPHTTLLGAIRDQAELGGVLDVLYGLHLPILKVEKVGEMP